MNKQRSRALQRRQLDTRIKSFQKLTQVKAPPNGWIATIREALGMRSAQLARRLKISQASLSDIEKGENSGTTTLNTLKRAAKALECDFVYALVPHQGTLTKTLESRAQKKASLILQQTSHSMNLEEQGVKSKQEYKIQAQEIADELIDMNKKALWEDEGP